MRVQTCTCTQKFLRDSHEVARFLREYPHVRSVLHTTDDELISRIFSIFFNHKYSVHCIGFVQLKSVLCRSYFNFDSRTFTECRKMNRAQNLPSSSEWTLLCCKNFTANTTRDMKKHLKKWTRQSTKTSSNQKRFSLESWIILSLFCCLHIYQLIIGFFILWKVNLEVSLTL